MSYKGDIGLYLSGGQVPIPDCGIFVTPPTVKQITQYGEDKFFQAVSLIAKLDDIVSEIKQGNPGLSNYDNFQILMTIVKEQEDLKETLSSFFELVFPNFTVLFADKSMDFFIEGGQYPVGKIHTFNLASVKLTLSELFLPQNITDEEYNPVNEAAAKIAEKLKKAKEKIKKSKSVSEDNVSIIALYVSTLAVGMCMDINTLYNYTLFQIYDVYNRYWLKTKYDLYQKIATTPMMDVSKMEEPKEWAQNLYGQNLSQNRDSEPMRTSYDLT